MTMNANTIAPVNAQPAARFDERFIESHQLIDRYLEGRLPPKGARDLENWCRANPRYLESLKLSDRTQSSLKLLEACGRPIDFSEPKPPWWKSPYLPIGAGVVAFACLLGFWALFGKYVLLRGELEDTRTRSVQGSLVQPAVETSMHVAPDRSPGVDHARITVNRNAPQLVDLHVDLGYGRQPQQYRLVVDKRDQGRALILNGLLKDSNGELRVTFNTTGLAAGIYEIRIESLPVRASGSPSPEGWFILDVR
jgi:hypothetical protein